MTINPQVIHSESHSAMAAVIHRDGGIIIERWSRRAVEEQANARRVHHPALLDHLPRFLQELSTSLAASNEAAACNHCRSASDHGNQRWEAGWSLTEVVRDYQILRLVLVEYLEEILERPLAGREVMALGLALDEAIAASIATYVNNREEYVLEVERDRTEAAQQAEEALRQQAEVLREANRSKDEFLAILGHELRNLLAPVRNATQILSLQGDNLTTIEWVRDLLERQVHHMTRLVDDLLDVGRFTQGKITLQRKPIDLVRLVHEAAKDRDGDLGEAGLTLQLELPAEPIWVEGDSTRLAQVMGNLLHNALKFTDKGGQVTVRVERETDSGRAAVTVRDTGIGMEPDLVPRVFDTFMQGDRSVDRSRGGLGLGLALVKGLIELHGGEIRAFSDGVGRGAEFTFWLPLEEALAPPSRENK